MSKDKNSKINITPQQIAAPDGAYQKTRGAHKDYKAQPLDQNETITELDGVRKKVFLDRYALKDEGGELLEHSPEEMWHRVAWGIAQAEDKKVQKEWEKKFYDVMKDFKFVPGGRILSGAGTSYDVTFFNCFVIPSPKDSRYGILESLKQLVEIQSRAGGVGLNLSSLRPRGARVKKVNGVSSGPITWAGLFSYATHDVVQQGGCFAPDTLIMTHLGLVPISEIVKDKRDWFVATHAGYKKVTTKFDNGRKELFEITTNAGYQVKVTADHQLLTVYKEGHFYLKRLKDFKIGENLVMLLGDWSNEIPLMPLNTTLPEVSKYSYGRIHFNLPKQLNEKLAYLVGLYDADGSKVKDEYSPHGKGLRIAIAKDRPHDLQYLLEIVKDLFGVNAVVSEGDGEVYNVSIYGRDINEFLVLNGLLKEYSVNVKVPDKIFSSPRSVVEAYIAGVFTGDGGNRGGKGGLRISSVSKKFVSDIQLLLINLGIPSKIKIENREDRGWKTLYTITVNGARFMKKFNQILTPYTEKVNDHKVSQRDATFNWPFNLTEKYLYLSGFQRTMARTNVHTSQKSVAFLEARLDTVHPEDREDIALMANSICDHIVSIDSVAEGQVYDLEVDKIHLLSGNGFYTSNSRRGATMLMLWDWHPDIEEFITVKQDLSKINGANLSVCVSDAFMEAVKKDVDWDLIYPDLDDPEYDEKWNGEIDEWKAMGKRVKVYKTVKAKELWNLICEAAWRSAEPGLHFLERSNKRSNTSYFEKLLATNPCGEQPLGAWSVCNLGAMNLAKYVKNYEFDYESFSHDIVIAMRFLDNVIDQTYYFFPENEKRAKEIRRTGLGIMGLADALIMMKIRYGSEESLPVIRKIFETLRDNAYEASSDIAREKGSFSKYDKDKFMEGYHVKNLPEDLRVKISQQGIRNAVLLTIAPTGTTSTVAGASSGIEPVYEFSYNMKWRDEGNRGWREDVVYHPLYQAWLKEHPGEEKPDYFASANDLTPLEHVKVQAVAQEYIDSSISKTVNAPNSHTVEDVKTLYMAAYDMGLKGVTYMRDGSREGVLSKIEDKKEEKVEEVKEILTHRPMMLNGRTYKLQTPVGEAFITINRDEQNQPLEVFATIGKGGMHIGADAEAIGRMISLALRTNPTNRREVAQKIVSQLVNIGGSSQVGFGKGRVMSLADAIAKVLAEDLAVTEVESPSTLPLNISSNGVSHTNGISTNGVAKYELEVSDIHANQLSLETPTGTVQKSGDICPDCGNATLIYEEGCSKCYTCGYSKC